jgi:hypothetical protein
MTDQRLALAAGILLGAVLALLALARVAAHLLTRAVHAH